MSDITYEPTREHWTPFEPWMRDLLADDARTSALYTLHDGESRVAWQDCHGDDAWFVRRDLRIHPDDVPEQPAEDDPDEALAKALCDMGWTDVPTMTDWIDVARAAREHIEQEIPEELDKIGITWQSRARRMGKRAEKAEAEVERLTRERDEWKARHAALRADVDEFQYKHREYPGTWELVDALARDTKRGQAEAERDEWKVRYKALRADVESEGSAARAARDRSSAGNLDWILDRDDERGERA